MKNERAYVLEEQYLFFHATAANCNYLPKKVINYKAKLLQNVCYPVLPFHLRSSEYHPHIFTHLHDQCKPKTSLRASSTPPGTSTSMIMAASI